ncbi:MAG TPA: NHLP bacteriocin system secretion protein [Stellaceae bacterium]|nr:NHLP bacteriocin system secretion protein [Stellaceae bacterium]
MQIVKTAGWLQLAAVTVALLVAVIWAALLDVPIVVKGQGMLLSAHGMAEITVPSRGSIAELFVGEGANVKSGDLIARIDRPDLQMQLATKEAMLREARERLKRHVDLNNRLVDSQRDADTVRQQAAAQRVALLSAELTVLRKRNANLNDLSGRGITTLEAVLASETKMHEVEIAIGAAKAEIAGIFSASNLQLLQQERELTGVTDQIAQLETETAELRKLLTAETEIRSVHGGRVVEMKASAGNFVEIGSPLLTLLRDDDDDPTTGPLYALVYVPQTEGKNVKVGEPVLISPSSVEQAEFGMIHGKVRSVAETPATTAGMMHILKNDQVVKTLAANGAPFMVTIELEADPSTKSGYAWSSTKGPDLRLTGGTMANSEIVVRDRRLLGVIIPPLARLLRDN